MNILNILNVLNVLNIFNIFNIFKGTQEKVRRKRYAGPAYLFLRTFSCVPFTLRKRYAGKGTQEAVPLSCVPPRIPGHGAGLGQTQGPHPARDLGPPPPQAPGFRRVPADAPCDGPSNPLCPVFEPYGSWSRPVHDAGRRHPAPHPGPSIWRSPPLPGRGSVRCRTRELFVSQGHGSRPSAGTRVPGKRRIPVFCNGPSRASWVRTDGHRTGPASRVANQQVARTHGGQVQSADRHPPC